MGPLPLIGKEMIVDTSTKGHILEKGAEFSLSKQEYAFLLQGGGYLPRTTHGKDLVGFHADVDALLVMLRDDHTYTEDDDEKEILKALIDKFVPMSGKAVFIS